jgi:tetratricopeptide (TPR) repeat protein
LIALSKLPVDKSTLESGSCDAGKTIRHSNQELQDLIQQACGSLNLKRHYVSRQGPATPNDGYGLGFAEINGPIDLEGHRGYDGRYYLLDFSRLFPPSKTDNPVHCAHLFQLHRPEFVRRNPVPLCSDALSRFVRGAPQYVEHASELASAEVLMETDIIPAFANMLRGQASEMYKLVHLVHSLHRQGINVRRIGRLRALLSGTSWSSMLLVEMIARTNKWVIRSLQRSVASGTRLPADVPFKEIAVKHLNVLFGDSCESKTFWRTEITEQIRVKFGMYALEDHEQSGDGLYGLFARERSLKCMLFQRLSEMTGLMFSSTTFQTFSTTEDAFDGPAPFDISHIQTIVPRVKHLTMLEHSQAAVIKYKADMIRHNPARIGEYLRLARLAIDRFERALACNPSSKFSLRSCADLLAASPELPQNQLRAQAYYTLALEADPDDVQSLTKYAAFLLNVAKQPETAEDYVLRAMELEPSNVSVLLMYADLLAWGLHDSEMAHELYQRAQSADSTSPLLPLAQLKYAYFLWSANEHDDEARRLYEAAMYGNVALALIDRRGVATANLQAFLDRMASYDREHNMFVVPSSSYM